MVINKIISHNSITVLLIFIQGISDKWMDESERQEQAWEG